MKWQKYAAPDAHLSRLRRIAFAGDVYPLLDIDGDVMRWQRAASAFHATYGFLPEDDVAALVAFSDAVRRGLVYNETTAEWRASEWERFECEAVEISAANLRQHYRDWEECDGVPGDAPSFSARQEWVRREVKRLNREPRVKPATVGSVEQHLKRCKAAYESRHRPRAKSIAVAGTKQP